MYGVLVVLIFGGLVFVGWCFDFFCPRLRLVYAGADSAQCVVARAADPACVAVAAAQFLTPIILFLFGHATSRWNAQGICGQALCLGEPRTRKRRSVSAPAPASPDSAPNA